MKSAISFWEKENFGKLLIRLTFGLFFVALGIRHFTGGMSALRTLGAIFEIIGLTFWPGFLGTFSAIILILGGMCFLIGFFFKTNCSLLWLVFLLRALTHWFWARNFFDPTFLCDAMVTLLLFSFLFIGPGRFSSDGH